GGRPEGEQDEARTAEEDHRPAEHEGYSRADAHRTHVPEQRPKAERDQDRRPRAGAPERLLRNERAEHHDRRQVDHLETGEVDDARPEPGPRADDAPPAPELAPERLAPALDESERRDPQEQGGRKGEGDRIAQDRP